MTELNNPAVTTANLKDGATVVFRPMQKDDLDRSHEFFQSLPETDRQYLRLDVSKREFVAQRIATLGAPGTSRLVALIDDTIVADGALELDTREWKRHMGEIRLIVARAFQRRGLGMLMARELYRIATAENVEQLIAKMMEPQMGARRILERLGFREDARLPVYVRDIKGQKQDLIVMRCNLQKLWQELEDYFAFSDWQRAR